MIYPQIFMNGRTSINIVVLKLKHLSFFDKDAITINNNCFFKNANAI